MRKQKVLIFLLLAFMLVALVGCSPAEEGADVDVEENGAEEPGEEQDAPEPEMDHLLVQSSSSGGIGYSYFMGMASIAEDVLPDVTITLEATDGYVDNAVRLSRGIGEMGVMGAEDAYKIAMRLEPYQDAEKRVLAVFAIHTLDWHIIVPADSDIQTIKDLEGKVINLQPQGSIAESMSTAILDVMGISYHPQYLPHAEAADAMRTGTIDAHLVGGSSVPFRELAERYELRLISLSDEEIERINQNLPYLVPTTFDGSIHYKGTETIKTVTQWAPAVAREDVPDDIVYALVKGVYENQDRMIEAHPGAENMAPEQILEMGVPVHPGAIRYYEEIGIEIPDSLRP